MVRRPAGDERNLLGTPDHLPHRLVDACADRLVERLRLLEDLFEHEVGEPAFLGILDAPVHEFDPPLDLLALVVDLNVLRGYLGDIPVLQKDDTLGMLEEGRHIRCGEELAVADAEHQGTAVTGGDDPVVVGRYREDCIGSFQERYRLCDCIEEIAGVLLFKKVDDHLGIGLGAEGVTALDQLPLEFDVVLDNTVVDEREPSGTVGMGMGVDVVRFSVRRPPGMPDTDGTVQRDGARLAVRDSPALFKDIDIAAHRSDAERVVPPILQSLETLNQERRCLPSPDVTNDSTHP